MFAKQKAKFASLNDLGTSGLIPGDVLIQKVWNVDGVVLGQALFSHKWRGQSTARHAAIAIASDKVVHAIGDDPMNGRTAGIYRDFVQNLTGKYIVYRPTNGNLGCEAAYVADRLASGNSGFGTFKSLVSPFRRQKVGKRASRYVTDLHAQVYGQGAVLAPKMFCAELVAACYEVAALQLDGTGLNVDPRAMSVKALESVLKCGGLFLRYGKVE